MTDALQFKTVNRIASKVFGEVRVEARFEDNNRFTRYWIHTFDGTHSFTLNNQVHWDDDTVEKLIVAFKKSHH